MEKIWQIREPAPASFLQQLPSLPPLLVQLLYNRGRQSQRAVEDFLQPAFEKLHDPFLFKDMRRAGERIWRAIENQELILVHGDYDADGVTSAAVLMKTLKIVGANVQPFIPHREIDGYGLNLQNVNNFIVQGVKLLITVDCGITNVAETAALQAAGVDVIITDHHEPPETLPAALALINPKIKDSNYPFQFLSGVGIAYKLAQAILRSAPATISHEQFISYGGMVGFQKWLLDIVALGTVADVVPLIDENRILVKWGLVVLKQTRNWGLKKLMELAGVKEISAETLAYRLAPRLNAAGRMNHASVAFSLLMTDSQEEAAFLAGELQKNNTERQRAVEGALVQAKAQISARADEKVLFVFQENWPLGIIGLVAGKICDQYHRPVFALTLNQEQIVGSGRGVVGCNITEGLRTVSTLLVRFGGHAQACGFTLAKTALADFQNGLKTYLENELRKKDLRPTLLIDLACRLADIDLALLEQIAALAPFGEGNEQPKLLFDNLTITNVILLGRDKNHLRLLVRDNGVGVYKLIFFNEAEHWFPRVKIGQKIAAVCEPGINQWNGRREIELRVVDLKLYETKNIL